MKKCYLMMLPRGKNIQPITLKLLHLNNPFIQHFVWIHTK